MVLTIPKALAIICRGHPKGNGTSASNCLASLVFLDPQTQLMDRTRVYVTCCCIVVAVVWLFRDFTNGLDIRLESTLVIQLRHLLEEDLRMIRGMGVER
jgi:hypothetical protein